MMKNRDEMHQYIIEKAEAIVFIDRDNADCRDVEEHARFELEEIEDFDIFIREDKIDDFLLKAAKAIVDIQPKETKRYFDFEGMVSDIVADCYHEIDIFGEIWWAK